MSSPPLEGLRVTPLENFPPPEQWDHWEELDAQAWPRRVKKAYQLVPTICFNCEAACGLLAYVDRDSLRIQKFEGNPVHPGSRGRNCAKGPATLNQVQDPERILYPLRRVGPRGGGQWERVTWDDVLDDIAGRIRAALVEGRQREVMYHLGRPGHELVYLQRVFHAWGIDGHNSHTNVCSASARAGYAFWHGMDRPSPDHANARFILLLSSHLETGHYFNPHAQRIVEARMAGAKMAVLDPRLSNTASMADYWLAPAPGTDTIVLLALANQIAKARYMTNGQVALPLVIRTANGGGLRFGAQHSQSVETWAMQIPGLKVVVPSTPADMIGLFAAAVRDPDPVIVAEPKALYPAKGEVPDGEIVDRLGEAKTLRDGEDVTIGRIFRSVIPYWLILLVCAATIAVFPSIATSLVRLAF